MMHTLEAKTINANNQREVQKHMKDSPVKINYTYDSRNRMSSVRYENGTVMTYRYDPVGNLIACNVSSQPEAAAIDSSPSPSPQPVQTVEPPSPCPSCRKPVAPGKKFCSTCGAPVSAPAPAVSVTAAPPPSSVCTACGNPIKPGAKFCAKCGRKRT
jgi:YD repeat-containing protein